VSDNNACTDRVTAVGHEEKRVCSGRVGSRYFLTYLVGSVKSDRTRPTHKATVCAGSGRVRHLQYFDTVGWVFWPVKTVSRITYTVLEGTRNTAQSINQSSTTNCCYMGRVRSLKSEWTRSI